MTDSITAEIVTFRTLPGLSSADVVAAARDLEPFLATCPGFLSRDLIQGEDGSWTDHVLWASHADAKAAGARIMSDPGAAAFMAMIDGPSVVMSHSQVVLRQTAKAT